MGGVLASSERRVVVLTWHASVGVDHLRDGRPLFRENSS